MSRDLNAAEIEAMAKRVLDNCPGDDLTTAVLFLLDRARAEQARIERGADRLMKRVDRVWSRRKD